MRPLFAQWLADQDQLRGSTIKSGRTIAGAAAWFGAGARRKRDLMNVSDHHNENVLSD